MRRTISHALLFVVIALCAARIYAVNHADWLDDYAAKTVVYDAGEEAELSSEYYFFSGYENLSGYYMTAGKAELVRTEALLAEYGMELSDLEALSDLGAKADFSDYEYTYILTARFGNRDYAANADYYIDLANFLLVGPDWCIAPATDSIMAIPLFNEMLNGETAFGIASDRELELRIAYLIDTRSESGLSPEYITQSSPKLLLGQYPYEVYLALPDTQTT